MTFLVKLLSMELCLHFREYSNDTQGYDWECLADVNSEFSLCPRGQMRSSNNVFCHTCIRRVFELHLPFKEEKNEILEY